MQVSWAGHLLVGLLKMVSLQHKSTATGENTLRAGIKPSCNNSELSEGVRPVAEASHPSPLPEEVKAVFPSILAAGCAGTDWDLYRD